MEQGQQTQYIDRNAAGTVAGKLFLTIQHASQLQSLLQFQAGSRYIAGSHNNYQQLEAAKLICKCRIGHEHQWTNSKAADGLSASWNCTVPFDVHGSPSAVHIGVYATQPNPDPCLASRSSSFLSVVSRSLSSMSMKSSGGVLQRLSSRNFRGVLHQDVQDSNTPLREVALQAPPDVNTPFTQRLQDTDLAAAYSESPSPSQSAKGSFTNLGAESAQGSRGNKENEGGIRRNRAGSESKYFDKQNHVLLGGVRIPLQELLQQPHQIMPFPLFDRHKEAAGTIQVKSEFVAILREGWLQFRKEPRSLLKSWKVGWFELLADGKLAWYPSPSKKPHETRGQISMAHVENMGLATAFKHTVNGRSYLEVHHRAIGSKPLQILSLKANHPDDAAQWLQDMRGMQKALRPQNV
ncbi:hypothetical protein ABBQ38_014714 [Trebouxia sp. C0009 RCD-2024]